MTTSNQHNTPSETSQEICSFRDILARYFDNFLNTHNGEQRRIPRLIAGIDDLDKMTTGFHTGNLIIVGGRPSVGKTAFALNLATNVSIRGNGVAIFTAEMSKEETVFRILCAEAKVNFNLFKTGNLSDESKRMFKRVADILKNFPIYIDDTPELTIADIEAKAEKLKAESDIKLIIIDYLQLLKTKEGKGGLSELLSPLKDIAKKLDLPVIALTQVRITAEMKDGKRPHISDIPDSDSIKDYADLVLFIHRKEIYNNDPLFAFTGKAEIIIEKNNNGQTGVIQVPQFDLNLMIFGIA